MPVAVHGTCAHVAQELLGGKENFGVHDGADRAEVAGDFLGPGRIGSAGIVDVGTGEGFLADGDGHESVVGEGRARREGRGESTGHQAQHFASCEAARIDG